MYARSLTLDLDTDLTDEYQQLDTRYPETSGIDPSVMGSVRSNAQRNPETGRIYLSWPPGGGSVMVPFYALGYGIELMTSRLIGRPADYYCLIPQYLFAIGSLCIQCAVCPKIFRQRAFIKH